MPILHGDWKGQVILDSELGDSHTRIAYKSNHESTYHQGHGLLLNEKGINEKKKVWKFEQMFHTVERIINTIINKW